MAGPSPPRIIEVWVSGKPEGRIGSGYLIGKRQVLTAGHVVGEAAQCEVRSLGQADWVKGRVVWRDLELDVALVEGVEDVRPGDGWRPVRWGRVVGSEALDCRSAGFPDSQERPGRVRDTEQLEGRIMPLGAAKSDRLVINVWGATPEKRELWRGMSGAAVFVGEALVGVLCTVPKNYGSDRLEAIPVRRILEDREAVEVLRRAGHGQPHLEPVPEVAGLEPGWEGQQGPWRSPSELLEAKYEVVPFRGRGPDIEDAVSWCEREGLPVRLLVGGAGRGKSRLAIELCRRMAAKGWLCGFLSSRAPVNVVKRVLEFEEPALLVVDWAENRSDLGQLLEPLAVARATAAPLRLLLLARAAGEWWWNLMESQSPELREMVANVKPQTLAALDETASDRAVAFKEAAQAFAKAQGMDPRSWTIPDLGTREFEAILQVHMAALDAVGTPRDPGPGPGARHEVSALEAMYRREASYWRSSAQAAGLNVWAWTEELKRVVAMATLVGADDEESAVELLRRIPALRADGMERARRDLARWHHDIYPGGEWLVGLQPEALGEELVGHVLERMRGLAAAALSAADNPQRTLRTLTVLARTARRKPSLEPTLKEALGADLDRLAAAAIHVAFQTGDPIGRLLAEALEDAGRTPEALLELNGEIPWPTLALRETALVLARARVERARTQELPSELAWRLCEELSWRLSEVGRRDEALQAIEEAARIYRELAEARPDSYKPDLARSLTILSNRASQLGRRKEALEAIEEAVRVRRGLVWTTPELAVSLTTLSNRLSEMGRRVEALEAIEEAVGICRGLVWARPELAVSLTTLSNRLSELGRREEALEAIKEAVKIRGERGDPGPNLAISLTTLSNRLAELGRREEALEAIEEAVRIRRELVLTWPDAFRPDLAISLTTLSNRLAELGRREEALETIEEAVRLRRGLVEARPSVFRPDLAISLTALSNRLSELGRREEALDAIEEAVRMRRALAQTWPDAFEPELAISLSTLAKRLSDLDRQAEAAIAHYEAAQLRRRDRAET